MRTISGTRSGGTQRAAALVVVAGLASALSAGTASAEAVPPSTVEPPLVTATYHHDGGPSGADSWSPGDTGTPGVASVANPAAPASTAAADVDLARGELSAATSAQDNGTPVNRIDAESSLVDGFYLAAPATVTLTWAMSGQANASSTGDGFGVTDLDSVVAVDCLIGEGGCVPDDGTGETPPIGHRAGVSASGSGSEPLETSGMLDIALDAGWHTVLAQTSSSSRAVDTSSTAGDVALTFSLHVVDEEGEEPVGWASASGLLPVTGGEEIEDTPAPTPAQRLTALVDEIQTAAEDGAIRNPRPLLSKIETAQAAMARGDERAAGNALTALRNHLRAQSGKHIPADLATAWSSDAAAVFPRPEPHHPAGAGQRRPAPAACTRRAASLGSSPC